MCASSPPAPPSQPHLIPPCAYNSHFLAIAACLVNSFSFFFFKLSTSSSKKMKAVLSLPFKTTGSLYFARDWVELQLHSQPGPQLSLELHPPPPQPTVGSSIPNGLPDDSASALETQILATSSDSSSGSSE